MNIRLLKPSDARHYRDLRLEALEQNPEAFISSYEEAIQRENPIDGVIKNLTNERNFTFGAFSNEELVGVVTLLQETPIKLSHRANILAMYVCPKKRGDGVGKKLLSEAIEQAKSIQVIEKINLTVVTSNERAKKLYENLGFKVFGTEIQSLKIDDKYYDGDYMVLFL